MLAASAASASPSSNTATKSAACPAPPEAMTGTDTPRLTTRVRSRAKPPLVPSWVMDVSRISPAPRSAASWHQGSASRPVAWVPARVITCHSPATRRASTATTMHCEPKRRTSSSSNAGRASAAEFTPTLSAPLSSSSSTVATVAMPPPTVKGMSSSRATARTSSLRGWRRWFVAVMSRNTNSSAPSRA